MAKDYSKIKALASEILKCIGDEAEGENPSLPAQDNDDNRAGQKDLTDFKVSEEASENEGIESASSEKSEGYDKKNKKGASLAMLGSMLASKYNAKS
jgi:hypothetical protein